LFSTAGAGYAPDELLLDPDAFESAIESILAMPPRGGSDCARELPPGHVNTWKLVADRGFFAFDADPLGGPYRLIAKPHVAARITDLPSSVALVVGRIHLPKVSLPNATEVNEDQIRH
jgi:hypothetical protein